MSVKDPRNKSLKSETDRPATGHYLKTYIM